MNAATSVEYALFVDFQDGEPAEIIPAVDAHHAEAMARTIYAGRPTRIIGRELPAWRHTVPGGTQLTDEVVRDAVEAVAS